MSHSIRWATLAAGLSLAAAQASAVTINFDELTAGTTLASQYAGLGVVFTPNAFTGDGTSSSGEPWASNTHMTIVDSLGPDVGERGPARAGQRQCAAQPAGLARLKTATPAS